MHSLAGVKYGAGDDITATALQAIKAASKEEQKDRAAEKAAKKAAFDTEYDVGACAAILPSYLHGDPKPTCCTSQVGPGNQGYKLWRSASCSTRQLLYFSFPVQRLMTQLQCRAACKDSSKCLTSSSRAWNTLKRPCP